MKEIWLIVDCWTGSKELGDKINRIKNTAYIFTKKSGIKATPVIITSQPMMVHLEQLGTDEGVIIIDKDNIDKIMESITRCDLQEAISKFFTLLEGSNSEIGYPLDSGENASSTE